MQHLRQLDDYALEDRYERREGRVFMTGTQALVRIMLDQARRDREAGWRTAGFVSGYRGSPLGGVDQEMWRNKGRVDGAGIRFLPAVNEDLGATAVIGAQQAHLDPAAEVEGVFSMWYGKGPGVDRSGDALKHGNAYGAAPRGGVLVVAGDDHGCVSSSMPHQSDVAFMAWFMPTLNPASVAEYLAFGEYGIALSRYSGTWVGFKAISETVESGLSFELPADRVFVRPDFDAPPGGLHVRLSDLPNPEIELRMAAKLRAVEAFVEANPIDRRIHGTEGARYGIVTTGKAHSDTMEALRLLGLDGAACRRLGIEIYKVGMVWPLARRAALDFVTGLEEVLVVEEKRGIVESQLKEAFYDWPLAKPQRMVGKHDERLEPLIPWTGELGPRLLLPILAARLDAFFPGEDLPARARALTEERPPLLQVPGATRTPYFCSGCPHNTSTRVPEGSQAASGIGCHVMASWMDRQTVGYAQMGGEGVPWIAASMFNGGRHLFQNIGEGTWYHSGSLAVRQAVAAGANITFKVLFNDAVAMTGGQPVDGPVTPARIAWSSRAEGVERIAVLSDDLARLDRAAFPPGTTFDARDRLDGVQRELREMPGVTVILYVQTCATEKRRLRKRGRMAPITRRVVINEAVCEGCGDCSVASNCLSVEPVETALGRKRRINQGTCNADYSCLEGFCPSFVTVEGGKPPRHEPPADLERRAAALPPPELPALDRPWDLLVAGVGGTGVITVGAVVTMAAHLEGRGASVLDFTGFAQKFGTVLGYVRIAASPGELNQVRIDAGRADAVVACDAVVASSPKASVHYREGTRVSLNLAEMPTGDLVLDRDARLRVDERERVIGAAVGAANVAALDANALAARVLGDAVYANVLMLGHAWQRGLVPVGLEALLRAFALNGVVPERNRQAFALGRLLAAEPDAFALPAPPAPLSLDALIEDRAARLALWQDEGTAHRYRDALAPFRREADEAATEVAARALHRLMAYKDEYEVARLHAETGFLDRVRTEFGADATVTYHLAPPLLARGRDSRGRPGKRRFGPWMGRAFALLARMKRLRGTPFDPFGRQGDRRLERELVGWYEEILRILPPRMTTLGPERSLAILAAPLEIRGFGPVKERAAEAVRARVAAELG